MTAVYRIGQALSLIEAEDAAGVPLASAWRLGDDGCLARVFDPDGAPFHATAPTLWQTVLRAAVRLESFLRDRAHHEREAQLDTSIRSGVWRLPA